MKLLVTYMNGKTQTFVGVDSIEPVKNAKGETEAIVIDHFQGVTRLEPRRETELRGVKSMELLF